MEMLNIIGWTGTLCFSLCALPQAYDCWKRQSATGISGSFLALWLIGEVCALIYILGTTADPVIYVQYLFNLACLGVILFYKVK